VTISLRLFRWRVEVDIDLSVWREATHAAVPRAGCRCEDCARGRSE